MTEPATRPEPAVKGRLVIEVREDETVRINGEGLSRLETHGAILEAWRLTVGTIDLGWNRALRRVEALEEAAAGPAP